MRCAHARACVPLHARSPVRVRTHERPLPALRLLPCAARCAPPAVGCLLCAASCIIHSVCPFKHPAIALYGLPHALWAAPRRMGCIMGCLIRTICPTPHGLPYALPADRCLLRAACRALPAARCQPNAACRTLPAVRCLTVTVRPLCGSRGSFTELSLLRSHRCAQQAARSRQRTAGGAQQAARSRLLTAAGGRQAARSTQHAAGSARQAARSRQGARLVPRRFCRSTESDKDFA
eukprot:gene13291-biopygen12500